MIRTSCHTAKFLNKEKKRNLSIFINEYRRVSKIFINYIWNNGYKWKKDNEQKEFSIQKNKLDLPSMLTSDLIKKCKIDTFLTGRAMKCCLNQTAGLIKAETEKQRKRIYILNKLREENKPRKKREKLIKRIKQNIPVKPKCRNINPELNSICCDFQETDGEFNGFLRLKSITKTKMDIKIPIKYSRHSKRLMKKGELKHSFLVSNKHIDLRWDIPNIEKKKKGKTVGGDQGLKDVLTLSDKQTTPKTDNHGHSLEFILKRLCRKKKGGKSFEKTQDHRENFINWSINQLNFKNIKQINLERIWNIGYKSKRSRLLSHWTNTIIRDKVESIAEELGVLVKHQSSTYRSQRCSGCGMVRKSNRKRKDYECKNCGLILDADYNASLNHEIELPEIPYDFRNRKLNRKGFFWLKSGLFDLEGRSLQSLLPMKTENDCSLSF